MIKESCDVIAWDIILVYQFKVDKLCQGKNFCFVGK